MKQLLEKLLPRFVGHYRMVKTHRREHRMIEYWKGDHVWADTLHINIGCHWFLFAMPDWMCRRDRKPE